MSGLSFRVRFDTFSLSHGRELCSQARFSWITSVGCKLAWFGNGVGASCCKHAVSTFHVEVAAESENCLRKYAASAFTVHCALLTNPLSKGILSEVAADIGNPSILEPCLPRIQPRLNASVHRLA